VRLKHCAQPHRSGLMHDAEAFFPINADGDTGQCCDGAGTHAQRHSGACSSHGECVSGFYRLDIRVIRAAISQGEGPRGSPVSV
jgi:hypothetical protein